MAWPTPQEYNEAIQSPALCFSDAELRRGTPDLTPLGLPRPVTGNFASVYRLRCGAHNWAVRCFFREYRDTGARYAAIRDHLRASRLPHTVGFDYLDQGIRVNGAWQPILKMGWVEGVLLHDWIAAHLHQPASISAILQRWVEMVQRLEAAGVAHGDLQHGNVMVVGDELVLVDYDGMFVPGLAGCGSHEIGHANYQHPRRTAHDFGPWCDRFSAWVVAISLLAVGAQPDLWQRLNGGDECLLLRAADFASPGSSAAMSLLRAAPDQRVRHMVQRIEAFLALPPDRVPPLALDADAPPRVLPDWVAASLPPAGTTYRSAGPARRVIIPVTAAFLAAANGLPALTVVLVVLFVAAAVLGISFRLDPSTRARSRRRWDVRRARLQSRLIDRRMERLLGRAEAADREFEAGMATATHARMTLQARKAEERDDVRVVFGRRRARLEDVLRVLDGRERDRVAEALRRLRETRLRRERLWSGSIHHVGWRDRLALRKAGIVSARDVTTERLRTLIARDHRLAAAALSWRVSVDATTSSLTPRDLPWRFRFGSTWPAVRRQSIEWRLGRIGRVEESLLRAIERRDLERNRRIDVTEARLAEIHKFKRQKLDDRLIALEGRAADSSRAEKEAVQSLHLLEAIRFSGFLRSVLRGL